MSGILTADPFRHRFKHALGEEVYIPGCLVNGRVVGRANTTVGDQYEIVYYPNNSRVQGWFYEWEIEKQENKNGKTQH